MKPLPPLDNVRRDLSAHLYGLAHVLDRCIRPGAGGSMLNLSSATDELDFPKYDDFDLTSFPMARGLESVYRYAAHGEASRHSASDLSTDPNEGALGRMQVLTQTFASGSELAWCLDEVVQAFDDPDRPRGGFNEMVGRATARSHLDNGLEMSPAQVALLADISERTVANAMSSSSDDALVVSRADNGRAVIAAADARRWLEGRRAFLATVFVAGEGKSSDAMTSDDLGAYLRTTIGEHVSDRALVLASIPSGRLQHIPGQRVAKICRVLEWSEGRVQAWVDGRVDEIDPDDCEAMAAFLGIDARWLACQVMQVRVPDADRQLDATLTDAGIRHGYFDLPQRFARRLFPDDAFGGRGADEVGESVRLHVDGVRHDTDIRIKSQALVSPRKRFSAWFKAHAAAPGDTVRIIRTAERDFELHFLRCSPESVVEAAQEADPHETEATPGDTTSPTPQPKGHAMNYDTIRAEILRNGFRKTRETKKLEEYEVPGGQTVYLYKDQALEGAVQVMVHPEVPASAFAGLDGVGANERSPFRSGSNMTRFPKRQAAAAQSPISYGRSMRATSLAALGRLLKAVGAARPSATA